MGNTNNLTQNAKATANRDTVKNKTKQKKDLMERAIAQRVPSSANNKMKSPKFAWSDNGNHGDKLFKFSFGT